MNTVALALRRAEQRNLLLRVTKYVAKIIEYKISVENYNAREIDAEFGLPYNRISEIRNIPKYNKPISTNNFMDILETGLIDFSQLVAEVPMTKTEREFLEKYKVVADKKVRKLIVEIVESGADVAEILEKALVQIKKK